MGSKEVSKNMNRKTLSLILFVAILALPIATQAKTVEEMVKGVKDIAEAIGVAIVVIGWVIAGILYLTSIGSPEKIKTAKTALIAAVIGTVLVAIAKLGYEAIRNLLNPIIG